MQKLADVCIRRPVFALMLIAALVVIGVAGLVNLGVDRFPSVDLPMVSVRTNLTGASPEEMETEVTQRIEEAVNTVEGIDELRSVTGPGSSSVTAVFKLSRDIDVAAQDIRDRVSAIVNRLPDDASTPVVSKFDNDSSPILTLSLTGPRTRRELTEIADKIVKVQLERSTGVGQVRIAGGLGRTINVWVDPQRLAAYPIPITAVRDALARQNTDVPGGNVTGPNREQILRIEGRLPEPRDFENVVVDTVGGTPIRVSDIGSVADGTEEPRSITRLNGTAAVTIEILRQSKANTVEVIASVKQNLAKVLPQLPADIKVEIIRDQSRYIYSALHEINLHLIVGSVLASLVVFLFVRSWRSTIIAAIAIPASLVATFGVMWAMGFTLNGVTMLALVLMVGIVIDDAIVVLENIFRFIEEKHMTPFQAAKEATAEIGLAVMATTFSLVVIFVPVSFMSSISGRFLYQFGLTAAAAVLVSLLVSFTLTPMMSARLLKAPKPGEGDAPASRRGFYRYIESGYGWLLAHALRARWVVALLAIGTVASAWPIYALVKQEYLPADVDESEFSVSVTAPEGTALAAMDDATKAIEAVVRSVPGVRIVQARVGGGFLGQTNQSDFYVRIAPSEERSFSWVRLIRETLRLQPGKAFEGNYTQRQVMQDIRRRLRGFTDVRTGVRNFTSFNIGGGGNWDIDFVLRGPDLLQLYSYADSLRQQTATLGGFLDADISLRLNKPELRTIINRPVAKDLGIDVADIGLALRLMVGGDQEVTRYHDSQLNENYDVRLRLTPDFRQDAQDINQLRLTRRGGDLIELGAVADVKSVLSPSRIERLDRQRTVSLRAGVAPGFAQADRIAVLRDAAAKLDMPPAYSTTISGRGRELERTFREFIWAFLLSVIFMYMILASQFESMLHPLTILLSLPLAVPFALLGLWATGGTLNLYSALGILVLFGVVKKNAILQIDHMNRLLETGLPRTEAILLANRDRLRPILMTTLCLVAGMLPLLLGNGPGAEERWPIAVVVVAGQSLSLLLTLIVTPVAYSYFDDLRAWLRHLRGQSAVRK